MSYIFKHENGNFYIGAIGKPFQQINNVAYLNATTISDGLMTKEHVNQIKDNTERIQDVEQRLDYVVMSTNKEVIFSKRYATYMYSYGVIRDNYNATSGSQIDSSPWYYGGGVKRWTLETYYKDTAFTKATSTFYIKFDLTEEELVKAKTKLTRVSFIINTLFNDESKFGRFYYRRNGIETYEQFPIKNGQHEYTFILDRPTETSFWLMLQSISPGLHLVSSECYCINESHRIAGTTNNRPQTALTGTQYFDMDIKKLLIFDGEKWVDVNGVEV